MTVLKLSKHRLGDKRLTIIPDEEGVGDVFVDFDDVQHDWTLDMAREIVRRYNAFPDVLEALHLANVTLERFENGEKPYQSDSEGEEIYATITAALAQVERST